MAQVHPPEYGTEEAVEEAVRSAERPLQQARDSSKLDWAVQFIRERAVNHKIVVFSQFVRLLQMLGERLTVVGVGFGTLHGGMSLEKRGSTISAFQQDEHVRVILCSTRAVGVGISLCRADTVLMLDPWWNKAVEEQAIDRVHRIGQTRKVEVVRLMAKDTVEEQIVAVQEVKRGIFDVAMSHKSSDDDDDQASGTRLDMVLKIFRGPWNNARRGVRGSKRAASCGAGDSGSVKRGRGDTGGSS